MSRETVFHMVAEGTCTRLHFPKAAIDAIIQQQRDAGHPVEDLRSSGVWSVLIYPQGYLCKTGPQNSPEFGETTGALAMQARNLIDAWNNQDLSRSDYTRLSDAVSIWEDAYLTKGGES